MLSKTEIKIFQVLHETLLGLLNLFMEYFQHTENNYSFLLNHNGLSFLKTCFQWKKILEISPFKYCSKSEHDDHSNSHYINRTV